MHLQTKLQHLFWRAGFGSSLQDIERWKNKPLQSVVNTLLEESSKSEPIYVTNEPLPTLADLKNSTEDDKKIMRKSARNLSRDLNVKWIEKMTTSPAQLREKMTLFWHGHFACQGRFAQHTQLQINTLRQYALGNFGDLVLAIAKDPAMLSFLNNQQNRKRRPNENFARELMELFTLGRGNYTEKDIKESARAFTGWSFDGEKYIFRPLLHDNDEKTFMGKKGNFNGEDIIKIILEKPETANFIVTKIYKFFVNDQPDQEIIGRLARNFYQSNYDIKALMKEIFVSDWFYDEKNIGAHIKSPIELLVGLQRQLNFRFLGDESILFIQKVLGQILLFPPNVAGWAGGRSWIDSSTLLFRLKLPETIFKLSEISFEAKDEEDVQKAGLVNKGLKRFAAEFDWSELQKTFGSIRQTDSLYDALSLFLLQKQHPDTKKNYISLLSQNNVSEGLLKEIAIAIAGSPEYQVS